MLDLYQICKTCHSQTDCTSCTKEIDTIVAAINKLEKDSQTLIQEIDKLTSVVEGLREEINQIHANSIF